MQHCRSIPELFQGGTLNTIFPLFFHLQAPRPGGSSTAIGRRIRAAQKRRPSVGAAASREPGVLLSCMRRSYGRGIQHRSGVLFFSPASTPLSWNHPHLLSSHLPSRCRQAYTHTVHLSVDAPRCVSLTGFRVRLFRVHARGCASNAGFFRAAPAAGVAIEKKHRELGRRLEGGDQARVGSGGRQVGLALGTSSLPYSTFAHTWRLSRP